MITSLSAFFNGCKDEEEPLKENAESIVSENETEQDYILSNGFIIEVDNSKEEPTDSLSEDSAPEDTRKTSEP